MKLKFLFVSCFFTPRMALRSYFVQFQRFIYLFAYISIWLDPSSLYIRKSKHFTNPPSPLGCLRNMWKPPNVKTLFALQFVRKNGSDILLSSMSVEFYSLLERKGTLKKTSNWHERSSLDKKNLFLYNLLQNLII